MRSSHVLSIMEFSRKDIESLIRLALKLKKKPRPVLKNKVLTMIFQKPSTRTRISFEVAMLQLGGHAINLPMSDTQAARGETMEDTARTLSLYSDAIAVRVHHHEDLAKLVRASSVPVINMLSDIYHPCQILGDLLTIKEIKRNINGLKVAWVGDGNNVCNSLVAGCAIMGMNISVACPPGYEPYSEAVAFARKETAKNRSVFEIVNDPRDAVKNSDIVYTDAFVSMGKEPEKEERMKLFFPRYHVNSLLMNHAKSDAIFMHCLPAKRGEEVSDNVIDGKQSAVWQQAENRLHAQKALLCLLLLKNLKGL